MPRAAANAGNTRRARTNALTPLTRTILWAKAGGRCQYAGCNKLLIGDMISGAEDKNFGFVAHIVADTPDGPRGHPIRSAPLSNDVNNLMLLFIAVPIALVIEHFYAFSFVVFAFIVPYGFFVRHLAVRAVEQYLVAHPEEFEKFEEAGIISS